MSLTKEAAIFVGGQLKYLLIGTGLLSLGMSFTSFSWIYVPVYVVLWLAGGVVCWLAEKFEGK